MSLRSLAIWSLMLLLAFANGLLREAILIPPLGEETGHAVSTLTLCLGILAIVYFAIRWVRPRQTRDSVIIGIGWLFLTLTFEFGFGLLAGRSLDDLFADYDVASGRIWVLVPLTTLAAPALMARIRNVYSEAVVS